MWRQKKTAENVMKLSGSKGNCFDRSAHTHGEKDRDGEHGLTVVGCRVVVAVGGIVGDTLAGGNDGDKRWVISRFFVLHTFIPHQVKWAYFLWPRFESAWQTKWTWHSKYYSECKHNRNRMSAPLCWTTIHVLCTIHSVFEVSVRLDFVVVRGRERITCNVAIVIVIVIVVRRFRIFGAADVCIIQFHNGLCQHNIPKPDSTPRGVCLQCINYVLPTFYGSINFSLSLSIWLIHPFSLTFASRKKRLNVER